MATKAPPRKSAQPPRGRARGSAPEAPDPFTDPPGAPVQQELAPAGETASTTGDAVVTAARAGLATISAQLLKFDEVKNLIPELERKYSKVVFAVDTPEGMEQAKAARKANKDPRVELEHARQAAKAPLLKLGRDIEAEAQALTARIRKVEDPIDQQITAQETKERDRKAALELRLLELQNTPTQCIGKTAAQLAEVLEAIESTPLEEFEEFRPRAAAAQESARQQVKLLLAQATQAEEFAALKKKQDDEKARKDALQARVDALGDCLLLPYRTSARVQEAINRLTATAIGDDFEEYAPAAREKKVAVIAQLVEKRDTLQKAEEAAAKPQLIKDAGTYNGSSIDAIVTQPGVVPMETASAVNAAFNEQERQTLESMARASELEKDPELRDEHTTTRDTRPAGASYGWRPSRPLLNTRGPMGMDSAPQATSSDHDRINDEAAQGLHAAFGADVEELSKGIENMLHGDLAQPFVRASLGPVVDAEVDPGHAEHVAGYERVELSMQPMTARPTDRELLHVLAAHYDVDYDVVVGWLRTIDLDSALAQLSLLGDSV